MDTKPALSLTVKKHNSGHRIQSAYKAFVWCSYEGEVTAKNSRQLDVGRVQRIDEHYTTASPN